MSLHRAFKMQSFDRWMISSQVWLVPFFQAMLISIGRNEVSGGMDTFLESLDDIKLEACPICSAPTQP